MSNREHGRRQKKRAKDTETSKKKCNKINRQKKSQKKTQKKHRNTSFSVSRLRKEGTPIRTTDATHSEIKIQKEGKEDSNQTKYK